MSRQVMLQNWNHEFSASSDLTNMMQLRIQSTRLPNYEFKKAAIVGLRPPGNPNLDALDEVRWCQNTGYQIVDWIAPPKQILQLNELLTIPRPLARNTSEVKLLQLENHLPKITRSAKETDNTKTLKLPDLQDLYLQIALQRPQKELPFCEIAKRLPENLFDPFRELNVGWPSEIDEIHIYTDGSYKDDQSSRPPAWSFVVLAKQGEQLAICGHGFGLVVSDSLEQGWTGAKITGPREAEIDAIIHALEWTIQKDLDVPHFFHFDSLNAGNIASGLWTIPYHDPQATLLRNLALLLRQLLPASRAIHWLHVKGHDGILGNEIADAIARWAFQEQQACDAFGHVEYLPYICGSAPIIHWLWFAFRGLNQESGLPIAANEMLCVPPVPQTLSLTQAFPEAIRNEFAWKEKPQQKSACICFASFNVGSLNPQKKPNMINLVQYMREQFCDKEVHVACLQETRAKRSAVYESDTHIRLIAGANQGQGGTELWLLKRDPCTHKILASLRETIVLHANNELLLVRIRYAGLQMIVLTGHAPHTGRPLRDHEQFWDEVNVLLTTHQQHQLPFVLCLDANAHFDFEQHPAIGPLGLEERGNFAAKRFGEVLNKFELCLPCTWPQAHVGNTWTWVSPANGHKARCDYIAIPLSWKPAVAATWNSYTIDHGEAHLDHVPTLAELHLIFSDVRSLKPKITFDRNALAQTEPFKLEQILQSLVQPTWETSIDEHATRITDQITACLTTAFPRPRYQQKKSYITADTWLLRRQRIGATRHLRSIRDTLSQHTFTEYVTHWRRGTVPERVPFFVSALRLFTKAIKFGRALKQLSAQLHKRLRADRTTFLESIAQEAQELPPHAFHKHMRKIGVCGKTKKMQTRPLPLLRAADGDILTSVQATAARWKEFFAEQEDGYDVQPELLIERQLIALQEEGGAEDWTELFTIQDLERQFRQVSPLRAVFDDGIPGEFLSKNPALAAKIFYPLFLKMLVTGKEPITFKGGSLVAAYKGKGDSSICESYRSLMVSSNLGKSFHAMIRRALLPYLQQQALPFQVGGLPKQTITQATHALTAFQWAAKQKSLNVAFLFVDIQNAFYRVIRQHIISRPDERGIVALFEALNLPDSALPEFREHLREHAVDDDLTIPKYLKGLLAEVLRDNWFQVPNSSQPVMTRRGTRPGDSLADLCFSFALRKILDKAYDKIKGAHVPMFVWSGKREPWKDPHAQEPIGLVAPIWADDIAIALAAHTASDLIAYAQTVAAEIFDTLASAGMRANLKHGKSELVLDIRGKGAVLIKQDLLRQDMMLPLPTRFGAEKIHVVGIYKHLGTWIATGGKMVYDIRAKIGAAHTTLTRYKAPIFANRRMSLTKKVQLFRSLVLTPIIFSAAAWHSLGKVATRTFVNGLHALYKRVAAMHFGKDVLHHSQDEICSQLGIEHPPIVLHVAKLRYVQQLVRTGQPQMWGLLQQTTNWWDDLALAFDWLSRRVPHLRDIGHPQTDWYAFENYLVQPGNAWKRLIKKATHFEIRYNTLKSNWDGWHRKIVCRLVESNRLPPAELQTSDSAHFCLACAQTFRTIAAWSVHAFRKHQRVTPARQFAVGTQCAICLTHYSTYVSLVNHLKYSRRCFEGARALGTVAEMPPSINSREEIKARKPLHLPPLRAEGPLPLRDTRQNIGPDAGSNGHSEQLLRWTQAYQKSTPTSIQSRAEALRDATRESVLHANEIVALFDTWITDGVDEEDTHLDLFLVAQYYRSHFSFEWFWPQANCRQTEKDMPWRDTINFWKDVGTFEDEGPRSSLVYKPICLAHLFSGHRRQGDIQSYAETWGGVLVDGKILSVDIVFDVRYGDLAREDTLLLFAGAIREGRLHALIAGPPCETWSVARDSDQPGPRNVRDHEHLSGLDALTAKELIQAETGNTLLGASLRLFTEAALHSAFFLLEHPEEATWKPHTASIWKIPIVQVLEKMRNVQYLHIQQGLFGADSPKPTRFMVANGIAESESFLAQFQTRIFPPLGRSIGKDGQGHWRTAKLKAYPAALCKGIVGLAEVSLRRLVWSLATDPARYHEQFEVLCQSFDYNVSMGPDFAG